MAYDVKTSPRAEEDLALIFTEINAENSATAAKWYFGLKDAVLTLNAYPDRCAATPEVNALRHLLYGKKPHVYRVIYEVDEQRKTVWVLHIRHGARQAFKRADLD